MNRYHQYLEDKEALKKRIRKEREMSRAVIESEGKRLSDSLRMFKKNPLYAPLMEHFAQILNFLRTDLEVGTGGNDERIKGEIKAFRYILGMEAKFFEMFPVKDDKERDK